MSNGNDLVDPGLLVTRLATALIALRRGQRECERSGCVVCGKHTLPQRDVGIPYPITMGNGLKRVSVLLANGRHVGSDRSPLCSKHWLVYIRFRLRYSYSEEKKMFLWLSRNLWRFPYKIEPFTDYDDRRNWGGDFQFTSTEELMRFTKDREFQKAIYRFYGVGLEMLRSTVPIVTPIYRYLDAVRFKRKSRYSSQLTEKDRQLYADDYKAYLRALRFTVPKDSGGEGSEL